jgi:hypothetical protein
MEVGKRTAKKNLPRKCTDLHGSKNTKTKTPCISVKIPWLKIILIGG